MIGRIIALVLLALPIQAAADPAQVCEIAADEASRRMGIPPAVMRALTLTETGRRMGSQLRPWAWAINHGGEGHWFETEAEAKAYSERALAAGMRNFDVGCFQLNHRWHGDNFPDLDAMFDPTTNALYAAQFLMEQYQRHGSWAAAAGAYHSNTPEFADRYRARFESLYAGVPEQAQGGPIRTALNLRINTFPLLKGGTGQRGSLVPPADAARRFIGN